MPTDVSSTRSHLEGASADWDAGVEYQWVILEGHTGAIAGTIALRLKGHAADFGYFLGRGLLGARPGIWCCKCGIAMARYPVTHSTNLGYDRLRNLRSSVCWSASDCGLKDNMLCDHPPKHWWPARDTAIYARTRNDQ